jgi:hypothetical protein
MWKDEWVVQLIEQRALMKQQFDAPPKQGVDLWTRVAAEVLANCPDFKKNCYDCAWLSLTALSTVTRNLWL